MRILPRIYQSDEAVTIYLISKRLRTVIDDYCLRQVSAQDRQILDVVSVHADTVFAKQAVLDQLPRRIQQIHQLVGVHPFARRKQDHLVQRGYVFQKLAEIRSCSHKHRVRNVLKDHREAKRRVRQFLQAAMYQRLILQKISLMSSERCSGILCIYYLFLRILRKNVTCVCAHIVISINDIKDVRACVVEI